MNILFKMQCLCNHNYGNVISAFNDTEDDLSCQAFHK